MVPPARRLPAWGALALVLVPVFAASASGTVAPAIPSGTHASFQALGLAVLDRRLGEGGLYAVDSARQVFWVEHQMVGALLALRAAGYEVDQAAAWRTRALFLWNAGEGSFDLLGGFYRKTVPPPGEVVCIDLVGQAWALLAAGAMMEAGVGPRDAVARRFATLRSTLQDLLGTGTHAGLPSCGASQGGPNPSHLPLALWSLLEARALAPDSRTDAIVRARLAEFLGRFEDGAYMDPPNFYTAFLNAWLLLVFAVASDQLGDANLKAGRDGLIDFLQNRSIVFQGPLAFAEHVELRDGEHRAAGRAPESQLWAAYALHRAAPGAAGRVQQGLVAGLLEGLLDQFWSRRDGAFVSQPGSSGFFTFEPNAMAALLTRGPSISNLITDAPSWALKVPRQFETVYSNEVGEGVVANSWTIRFGLTGEAGAPRAVLLPSADLSSVNLSASTSQLYRLSSTGTAREPVAFTQSSGPTDWLRFEAVLRDQPTTFRIDGFAPFHPVRARWSDNSLVLTLRSDADASIHVQPLRLELDALNLDIRSVSINGVVTANRVFPHLVTQDIDRPHMRILLEDATLVPGENEVLISYLDSERPVIEQLVISTDSQGASPVPRADRKHTIVEGDPLFARARVHDNGVLRNVLLNVGGAGGSLNSTPMTRLGEDMYVARIPVATGPGVFTLQVVAVDASRNLNASETYTLEVKDAFLGGNIVLFAFAATLFATAAIIWVKLRRKGRAP